VQSFTVSFILKFSEIQVFIFSLQPEKIILHPDYNKDNLTSDIALIIFSRDVNLNSKVAPICLWNGEKALGRLEGQLGTVRYAFSNMKFLSFFLHINRWQVGV
jgi:hypothetical protein